jgi:hypothetical protein
MATRDVAKRAATGEAARFTQMLRPARPAVETVTADRRLTIR